MQKLHFSGGKISHLCHSISGCWLRSQVPK